jgi:putative endonuclease
MDWFVYYLVCADGSIYTGMTNDLDQRLRAHQEGRGARYTRARRPVRLARFERYSTRSQAASREARVKRLPRVRKLDLLRPR